MSNNKTSEKKGFLDVFMHVVEKACDVLPPPTILFCILFLIVAVIGAICSIAGVELLNPATQEMVSAQNFFTKEGIQWLITKMTTNFSGFGPLALVLSMTLAIGFCEEAGLVSVFLRTVMGNVPAGLIPYACAAMGMIMNLASDAAGILVPPLSAIVYIGVGRHPIVGMLCGYAGANVGYAANPIISGTDTLIQGFTNQALEGFLPDTFSQYTVEATCNWFIKIGSFFLCTILVGTIVTKVIEPRFGKYEGEVEEIEETTPLQMKGLKAAGIALVAVIAMWAVSFFTGITSGPNGEFVGSPLLKGVIAVIFVMFSVPGIVYGKVTGSYPDLASIHKAMSRQMANMGSYVAFCFFAGQFQALFTWTNLGAISAIAGANGLEAIGFTGIPMIVAFVFLVTIIDIFFSSGSAKWAIFGPIFVPMFMLLGYTPAFTQYIYRLGDSAGNMFGPTSAQLWMILGVAQEKYDKNLTIGRFLSCNMTVAMILECFWIVFLVIWMLAGIPVGPGEGIWLATPIA
ncbi:MAG: AbgT family transporter [Lachnospiraceae bacterium]|nr:AbgT family transporter [Lachnospiraceae bacterium]